MISNESNTCPSCYQTIPSDYRKVMIDNYNLLEHEMLSLHNNVSATKTKYDSMITSWNKIKELLRNIELEEKVVSSQLDLIGNQGANSVFLAKIGRAHV